MRRPDTTEQCVWLGPSKHLDRCWDAAAVHSNSDAESFTFGDSMRGYSDSNTNCDSYGNSNYDAYTECNSVTDTHGHGYSYSISDTYDYTKSDTEASADRAS